MIGENVSIKVRIEGKVTEIPAKDLKVGMEVETIGGYKRVQELDRNVSLAYRVGLFKDGNVCKLVVTPAQEFAIDSNVSGAVGRAATKEDIELSWGLNAQPFGDIAEIYRRDRDSEEEHPVLKITGEDQVSKEKSSAPFVMWIKEEPACNVIRVKLEGNAPYFVGGLITH